MAAFRKTIGALSALSGLVAIICLVAACIVVCELVFVRYVLEGSTIWQTEFVLYSVVAATLLGSPRVLASGGHVGVDLLGRLLGPGARRWQRLGSGVLGLAFVVALGVSGTRYFHEAWANGWVTESVWAPPLWIVLLPLPVGFGVLALQYLAEIVAIFMPDTGEDPAASQADDPVGPGPGPAPGPGTGPGSAA